MPTENFGSSITSGFFSLRERYLIAQALVLGIEKLAEVKDGPMREYSNINDMAELLKSAMFAPFTLAVLEAQKQIGTPATTASTLVYYVDPALEDLPF